MNENFSHISACNLFAFLLSPAKNLLKIRRKGSDVFHYQMASGKLNLIWWIQCPSPVNSTDIHSSLMKMEPLQAINGTTTIPGTWVGDISDYSITSNFPDR